MKTFDIITIVVFCVMGLATLIASFYNPIHLLFSVFCMVVVVLAYNEFKSENDK